MSNSYNVVDNTLTLSNGSSYYTTSTIVPTNLYNTGYSTLDLNKFYNSTFVSSYTLPNNLTHISIDRQYFKDFAELNWLINHFEIKPNTLGYYSIDDLLKSMYEHMMKETTKAVPVLEEVPSIMVKKSGDTLVYYSGVNHETNVISWHCDITKSYVFPSFEAASNYRNESALIGWDDFNQAAIMHAPKEILNARPIASEGVQPTVTSEN